jgi:DNA (cytosine-5)-methyltransferase 1
VHKRKKLVFADAFAGCGGLSLGLMQAGWQGLFAIEKDKFAFETLKTNLLDAGARFKFAWPEWLPQKPTSIEALLAKRSDELKSLAGKVDLLVGGPPCQGFSSAGKRRQDDPRNRLFRSYVRLVNELKPRAVLIENVRGFTIDFDGGTRVHNYARKLRELLAERYIVHEQLLKVSDFGVPQARTRYFLIALERGLCEGNPFDHLQSRLPLFLRSIGLRVPVSSSSAISDFETSISGRRPSTDTDGFEEIDYSEPLTQYQKLMNDGASRPSDLRLARHMPEIQKRFAYIIKHSRAEGRLNTTISDELRIRFDIRKKALRVLDPDRPSPTVTSMPDDLLHYSEPRTLTVRENARLQSFPDWFAFKGKYTTGGHRRRREVPRFTQVANAVPPLVARAFGEFLLEMLRGTFAPKPQSSRQRVAERPEYVARV